MCRLPALPVRLALQRPLPPRRTLPNCPMLPNPKAVFLLSAPTRSARVAADDTLCGISRAVCSHVGPARSQAFCNHLSANSLAWPNPLYTPAAPRPSRHTACLGERSLSLGAYVHPDSSIANQWSRRLNEGTSQPNVVNPCQSTTGDCHSLERTLCHSSRPSRTPH
jgi:hypothetical protein